MSSKESIKKYLRILAKDFSLNREEYLHAEELLDTLDTNSCQRPSCIAMAIICKVSPALKERALMTYNISRNTLQRIQI